VVPELLELIHHLREAGIPVSMVETVDAAQALQWVDMSRRDQVRATLGSTLVKRADHRPIFEAHFDLYFSSVRDPDHPADRLTGPRPRSLISFQPASGMISSLGSGMQALSIAIRTTTPGHSIAL